jgi:hypothetical protein
VADKIVLEEKAFEKEVRSFVIGLIEKSEFPALSEGRDSKRARTELNRLLSLAHMAGLPIHEGPGEWDLVHAALGGYGPLCGDALKAMPEKIRAELAGMDALTHWV